MFLILKKRNANPEVCRNFFEEFYSKYNSKIFLENNFLTFIDKLLSKIHLNHILSLNFSGYEKLYFIYCVNPIMIDRLSPRFMLEPIINSKERFKSLFLSYDLISDIFSNYYISCFFTINFFSDKLNEHEKEWLIDLLKGKNLVYSKNLPFKLTKKQVQVSWNLIVYVPSKNISNTRLASFVTEVSRYDSTIDHSTHTRHFRKLFCVHDVTG